MITNATKYFVQRKPRLNRHCPECEQPTRASGIAWPYDIGPAERMAVAQANSLCTIFLTYQ